MATGNSWGTTVKMDAARLRGGDDVRWSLLNSKIKSIDAVGKGHSLWTTKKHGGFRCSGMPGPSGAETELPTLKISSGNKGEV